MSLTFKSGKLYKIKIPIYFFVGSMPRADAAGIVMDGYDTVGKYCGDLFIFLELQKHRFTTVFIFLDSQGRLVWDSTPNTTSYVSYFEEAY